jgi:hypothetical protein
LPSAILNREPLCAVERLFFTNLRPGQAHSSVSQNEKTYRTVTMLGLADLDKIEHLTNHQCLPKPSRCEAIRETRVS